MPNIASALLALRPGSPWTLDGDEYSNLTWLDPNTTQPTLDEVKAEIAVQKAQAPLDACKAKAKELIANTDWAVLPDVGLKNSADFVYYRGILRGLILHPVANPDFPTEPTPVWE